MLISNQKKKIMKKYLKNTIGLLFCLLIISCNDYLDIKPEDKYLEEDIFSSKEGIQTVLNGVYSNMSDRDTYGGNLTMSTVDVLAQRYLSLTKKHKWFYHATYEYGEGKVENTFNAIWSKMYVNILNMNNFIQNLDTYSGILSLEEENILRGEALGLRAMHHLDLLRLFGPIYSTNSEALAIPYSSEAKAEKTEILSASRIMELVLADLTEAEKFLENDPIREYGKTESFNSSSSGLSSFFNFRNLRLNYYAVKALQARAYLYAENKVAALEAAKVVIEEGSQWFEWTPEGTVISDQENPDRVFSPEILFAVRNNNLYAQHKVLFASTLSTENILAAEPKRLKDVFENNTADYRFDYSWIVPTVGGKIFKTFYKFDDIQNKDKKFRFMQPLIRMTEMYYIAAETEVDSQTALDYLNTARYNRGLVALENDANLQNEILKEYQREFFGEGQLFYYYKRNNFTSIPNGSTPNGTINMGADQYVVPLPLSETTTRQ